jgi:hypothetical protein
LLSFDYPWPGLEAHLAAHHGGRLPLFAYGSLLNAASAVRTMPGWRGDECRPANALGVIRVFNYPLTLDAIERYGAGPTPLHVAALGVRVTGLPTDRVNGLVYSLSADDLEGFRLRETGYRLIEVLVEPWGDASGDDFPRTAMVLEYLGADDASLLPHSGYLDVCREGAASFGDGFRDEFDRTTFLADGRRLSEYLLSTL